MKQIALPKTGARWLAWLAVLALALYGLLLLGLWCLHRGWVPGADHVLAGREIHSFGHYARYFSGVYGQWLWRLGWLGAAVAGVIYAIRAAGGWRPFLPRLVVSLLVAAALGEVLLRLAFRLPAGTLPALQDAGLLASSSSEDAYWVLRRRLSGTAGRADIHPQLGWTQTRLAPDNPLGLHATTREQLAGNGPHIYFFGDSFVHGMEFNTHPLPALLDQQLADFNVVNLGVRAYGVDQMYIKAQELGLPPDGGAVWVGILTWDLDRAVLTFMSGQRPRFRLEEDDLALTNVPLTQSNQAFIDDFRMPFRSWLWRALQQRWRGRGMDGYDPKRVEKIALNRAILRDWSAWCRSAGVPMRVVLFRPQQDLARSTWRTEAIYAICKEFDIPLYDTADVLLPYLESVGSWGKELYEPDDFHHTDLANELIADWLAQLVQQEAAE